MAWGRAQIESPDQYLDYLKAQRPDIGGLRPAIVTESGGETLTLLTGDGQTHVIEKSGWSWARERLDHRDALGPELADTGFKPETSFVCRNTASPCWLNYRMHASGFAAVNPEDGAIRALIGGFDFTDSKFNRALLASRQVGSGIKPFIQCRDEGRLHAGQYYQRRPDRI